MHIMRVSTTHHRVAALLAATILTTAGCGEVARTGRSPGYLVIDTLEGASGAEPDEFSNTVASDVLTLVEKDVNGQKVMVPTVFGDPGRVTLRLGLKNPGPADAPTSPGPLNDITVDRYRVVFRRADGRNTQGVDVPYAFDGGLTVTVRGDVSVGAGFDLVRIVAKTESPLVNMVGRGGAQFIGTIAEITFFGRDQAGHEVSVTGNMSISFADFGDPE
jgi:hypothetical protein